MLAELAAANAAFEVIKQTIQNGQDLIAAGNAVADYFGLKAEITKKAHEHGYKSDFAAFQAAEKLKEQEDELQTLMIWAGKPGEWTRWLEFQAEMKRSRDNHELQIKRKKLKRKQKLIQTVIWSSIGISVIGLVGCAIYITLTIMTYVK
jgi:hypothetical protein